MSKNYSGAIASVVEGFLTDDDWKFQPVDENGIIRTGITLESKLKNAKIFIDIKDDGFSIITVLPIGADAETMGAVAEFIARANYGTYRGGFEMDFSDGEIRYKTYHCCGETLPTYEQVKINLLANIVTVDRYGNGLVKVVFGVATPEEAIAEAESK